MAHNFAKNLFELVTNTNTYWSGRPDIIVEIIDKKTQRLKKVVLGEVKFTKNVNYALEGLRELVDYMKLVKHIDGKYLDEYDDVKIEGILFTHTLSSLEGDRENLKLNINKEEQQVRVVTY